MILVTHRGQSERAKRDYSDPVILNCRRCGMPRPIDEPCRNCQREQQESANLNRREP